MVGYNLSMVQGKRASEYDSVADFLYQKGKRVGVFNTGWLPDISWFIEGAVSAGIIYGIFRIFGGGSQDQHQNVQTQRSISAEQKWARNLAEAALSGNVANVADALAQDNEACDGNVAQGALQILSQMGDDGPRRLIEMVEKVAMDEQYGPTGRDDVKNFVGALQMSRDQNPRLTTQIGRARLNRFTNKYH